MGKRDQLETQNCLFIGTYFVNPRYNSTYINMFAETGIPKNIYNLIDEILLNSG